MRFSAILAFLFTAFSAVAQQVPVRLTFFFHNAGEQIVMEQDMPSLNGVVYKIEDIAFYVSKVRIVHDGGQETAIDSVYLFNDRMTDIVLENLAVDEIEGIRFMVGVPQELNHLDINQYPEGHPLSYQSPSMFWGWSAGYMHFIMSGYGDSNNDGVSDNNNYYQLHCTGDENTQDVEVSTVANLHPDGTRQIILFVNVDQWLEGADPATTGPQHGNTGINQDVMENVQLNPVFVAPANAGLKDEEQLQLNVYQSGKETTVTWDENVAASSYSLVAPDGKILRAGNCSQSSLSFTDLSSGMHVLRIQGPKNTLLGSVKWIVP